MRKVSLYDLERPRLTHLIIRRRRGFFALAAAPGLRDGVFARPMPLCRHPHLRAACLLAYGICLNGPMLAEADASPAIAGQVVRLPTLQVQGNPVEDFGFRVSPDFDVVRSSRVRRVYTPVVDLVLPNTAAARAGVRPGDRIVAADGQETGTTSFSLSVWQRIQRDKWREMRDSPDGVQWRLLLAAAATGELRQVTLQLPTPAPRWGGPVWRAPADRTATRVPESGPLAERAQQVLDHGIAMLLRGVYVAGFDFRVTAAEPHVLGYQWTLWDERGGHRLFVTTQRGGTEIILEFIARPNQRLSRDGSPALSPDPTLASERTVLGGKAWAYLTTPAGNLRSAWQLGRKEALAPADARRGFDDEVDFWLRHVGRVTERWPLEVLPEKR